jgi:arylsulfatase A-like enzyme
MAARGVDAASNSLVFSLPLLFFLASLPWSAASLLEEGAECADEARGEEWDDTARRMSLLQSGHEVKASHDADSVHGRARTAQGRPNIVLWLPDDMYLKEYSWWLQEDTAPPAPNGMPVDHVPIHSSGVMPNLARIAQSGATFTRAYSTSAVCTPSRYSIMTGRYPSQSYYGADWTSRIVSSSEKAYVGIDSSLLGDGRLDKQNTVAAALRNLGYTTGMTGKWHLSPEQDGASFRSPYSVQTSCVKRAGFDFVDGLYIQNLDGCSSAICGTFSHNLEWTLVTALGFMDSAMRNSQPFFLYFCPTPPHDPGVEGALAGKFTPYQTPGGLLSESPDVSKYCSSCKFAPRSEIWASTANISSLSNSESCRSQLAALRWLDESLGVLYDFLSERGAIANTYIVMATDHGTAKWTLYELGTRVPMYAVGPNIHAGTVVSELVSHIDLAPTFLEWAAGSTSSSISVDGLSWASLVSGEASSLDRDGIYMESMWDKAFVTRDGMKVYNCTNGKMVSNAAKRRLLENMGKYVGTAYPHLYDETQVYNLKADPSEQVNVHKLVEGEQVSLRERGNLRKRHRRQHRANRNLTASLSAFLLVCLFVQTCWSFRATHGLMSWGVAQRCRG